MPGFLFGFIFFAGVLFVVKMAYVASVAWSLPSTQGAIFVSTPRQRINAALDNVDIMPDQCVYDLGCGDARVLRAVRRRYGAVGSGFELNPVAWLKARLFCVGTGIRIFHRDFWKCSIRGADVIFCYLFPDVMEQLAKKIQLEAKPGAIVVSFNFPLPGMFSERTIRPPGSRYCDPVYIYRVPMPG